MVESGGHVYSRPLESLFAFGDHPDISFAEFLATVDRLSGLIPEGRRVINVCTGRTDFLAVYFAVLVQGGTNLLPSNNRQTTIDSILADDEPCFVIDNEWVRSNWGRLHDGESIDPQQIVDRLVALPSEHLASVVFSSGTTGASKPINKTWRSLFGAVSVNYPCLHQLVGEGASMVSTVPPWHMYGLEWTVFIPLMHDISVCSSVAFFPKDAELCLQRARSSRVLVTTPTHLRSMLDADIQAAGLKLVISATSSLDVDLAEKAATMWGCDFLEIYGCSELGSVACRRPLKNMGWELFPEFQASVSEGRTVLSASHCPEPIELSDVLVFDNEGTFAIKGRDMELVKIAGKRGSLASINNCLLSVKGVVDGMIFEPATYGVSERQRLAAFVVLDGIDVSQLRKQLQRLLDPVFVPRQIHVVESLSRGPTGKIEAAEARKLAVKYLGGRIDA